MANREAFIDFVHGLLNINPLERWSPQQARTHPFITQQKYTGPFQPHTSLKMNNRSPAPGVQQQQQAEALSKQRAQAQAVQVQQATNVAYNMHMNPGVPSYPTTPQMQQQPSAYQNMYSPAHTVAPPPYPSAQPATAYGQPIPIIQQPPPALNPYAQQQQNQAMYNQQSAQRGGRQRASTMDGNGPNGIPAALQRVVSHLDPNAPIRLQPSPAYYPPPQDGQSSADMGSIGRRRTSRAGASGQPRHGASDSQNRNFVRMLEDRTLEEGWNGAGGNNPGGWPGV
jgi:dual specificity protein kinase YAK1